MNPLRIAEPCHESWDAMTPAGRGRHCASCARTVIDVTAMAPAEGRAFVAHELPARLARGERVCVRARADARGRLLRPGVRRYLLTNGLAAVLAVTMAGCGGEPPVVQGGLRHEPQPVQPGEAQGEPGATPPEPAQPLVGSPAAPILDDAIMGFMGPPTRGEAIREIPGDARGQSVVGGISAPPEPMPAIMGDIAVPADPPTRSP